MLCAGFIPKGFLEEAVLEFDAFESSVFLGKPGSKMRKYLRDTIPELRVRLAQNQLLSLYV